MGGGKKGGKGSGKGGSKGYVPYPKSPQAAWDETQRMRGSAAGMSVADLARRRPQRPVDAFPHLTVAADWPERRAPRSGSAFYLPLMWTALLLEDGTDSAEAAVGPGAAKARQQLITLGDSAHFHGDAARRCTVEDVLAAQVYWRQVFSGWTDWVRRLRASMDAHKPGGREGIVGRYVQRLSVTACALVYGDLQVLGALPHISNARKFPDQDFILELDLMVRCELEACVATLFLPGGAEAALPFSPDLVQDTAATSKVAASANIPGEKGAAADERDKEVMQLKTKLYDIQKLKGRPVSNLDVSQQKQLEGEAEILEMLRKLGCDAADSGETCRDPKDASTNK
eukprot:gnl/TRDRNA2_/TRDRNA2_192254_c0_seq1.p1 gnl/TRDRNA2_/TRDRNA2_192254_c0~~gnl/TRDRNA2_/TRDRNA2_192254_c0_seq1.p1  ORF type:complete len:342 (+),score=77.64 gnl/TRDRNA2_/TRDRNA2_192254_c0_seq1:144-1169(+)